MKQRYAQLRKVVALLTALLLAGGTTGIKADQVISWQSTSSHSDSGSEAACDGLNYGDTCYWTTYSIALFCTTAQTLCCWDKPASDPENGVPYNRTDWIGACGAGPNGRTTCNNVTSVVEPGASTGTTYGAPCPPSGS